MPPVAVINGPTTATVGKSVTFTAANAQNTTTINNFQWWSGDGNTIAPGPNNSFTTTYWQPGIYYPNVIVTDGAGLSDTASMEITINAN